jgi:hypothetical protein
MRSHRASILLTWHSHTTKTSQPLRRSFARFALSLALFRCNLGSQYPLFERGRFWPDRQQCPCQKHP